MPITNPLHAFHRLRTRHQDQRLAQALAHQKEAFQTLRGTFAASYAALEGCQAQHLVRPLWRTFTASLERALLPAPSFAFLNVPTIMTTMFITKGGFWLRRELALLEARLPEQALRSMLHEDYVGLPLLALTRYLTSHNTVHHLYHLVRFCQATGSTLSQLATIVEWGGGYGNLAKIFRRFHGGRPTYVLIDLPLLACLQWLYLATIFGPGEVVLFLKPGESIQPGKFNIVPVCFLDAVPRVADLFVSTWALSESSHQAVDTVADRWFGARHLLLAYQKRSRIFPHAERVGELAVGKGAVIESIDFLPRSRYAFR